MRAGRGLSGGSISRSTQGRTETMQTPLGAVQTAQWSWILQTVWGWVWGGLSWIVDWQANVFQFVLSGGSFWGTVGKFLFLFFPATVVVAGVWGTMVSLYTIPFRSGRGRFLAAILMCWWDAVRMAWFYWFGLVRFLLVFVGWIWGLLRLGVSLMWRTLKNLVTSPFALLDSTSRQPGVPWIAFVLLVFWSAIEATIFTFTLRPTMAELLADLTGFQVNPLALVVILWFFLFIIIGGSFPCIQVLNHALKAEHEWFKKEAQHLMELLTLPVLQLVAGGFNFLVVVIMGKPHFNLPFRSLDQVLHSTPIFLSGKTSTVEGGAS